jgi:Matrixin
MRPHTRLLAACALVILAAAPVVAYLKLGISVGNRVVTRHWSSFPVRYFVTARSINGVTAQEFQTAITRAFATWDAVETADTSSEFVGFTQAAPFAGGNIIEDDMNVLGFVDEPGMSRVLGATGHLVDTVNGRIVESDIFFNSAFSWSTSASGTTGRFDVESIALHEIGHFFGLGHSALGETELISGGRRVLGAEAVMFPIAFTPGNIDDRTLKADDIAGISDIYGTSAFTRGFGSISGRVTKNGQGVVGAHIVAFHPATGHMVGGFSLSADGSFVIAGLEPGPHVLRAEPLDDGDIDSFFDDSLDVDVDFNVKFYERAVVVPRGGGTRNVEIRVTPK